jgi:hypothetical protein
MASLPPSLLAASLTAAAQETVCTRVKIEIKQELTLERQAFDAEERQAVQNYRDNHNDRCPPRPRRP